MSSGPQGPISSSAQGVFYSTSELLQIIKNNEDKNRDIVLQQKFYQTVVLNYFIVCEIPNVCIRKQINKLLMTEQKFIAETADNYGCMWQTFIFETQLLSTRQNANFHTSRIFPE